MAGVSDRILAQHRDLARVLKALETIVDGPIEKKGSDDMARLFDICHYIRVFPDKLHHPDEDRHVFGPLRKAAPQYRALLDDVQHEHERCDELTTDLHDTIRAFDRGETDADALRKVAHDYLHFEFEHMRKEERNVLPLVDEVLDEGQRAAAAAAFARHADPLFGENLATGFDALKRRILAGA